MVTAIAGSARRRWGAREWALHGFTAAMLAAWWLSSLVVPPYMLPGPGITLRRMGEFLTDPLLTVQLVASLAHVLAALAIAFVIGGAFAFAGHLLAVTRPLIDARATPFLNSFSGIGWLFLAIIWFGNNSTTVIFAVTMVLIPFAAINLRAGLNELDHELLELGRSLTRATLPRFLALTVPMLVPFAFATVRIGFGVAWKVVLTAELFGGNVGVGYLLNAARQEFDSETIFAVILFILIFVTAIEVLVFRPLQRRLDRRYRLD